MPRNNRENPFTSFAVSVKIFSRSGKLIFARFAILTGSVSVRGSVCASQVLRRLADAQAACEFSLLCLVVDRLQPVFRREPEKRQEQALRQISARTLPNRSIQDDTRVNRTTQ